MHYFPDKQFLATWKSRLGKKSKNKEARQGLGQWPVITQGGQQLPETHLFKCIPCNRLECLFHVDSLLGTGLEVGNVVFAVAPGLCSFRGHLEEEAGICVLILEAASIDAILPREDYRP